MSNVDDLLDYLMEHAPGYPFKVRAAMHELADTMRSDGADGPRSARAIASTVKCAEAMDGVCSLHLDNLWSAELRSVGWWKRRRFAEGRDRWRSVKWDELHAEARRDISAIRSRQTKASHG